MVYFFKFKFFCTNLYSYYYINICVHEFAFKNVLSIWYIFRMEKYERLAENNFLFSFERKFLTVNFNNLFNEIQKKNPKSFSFPNGVKCLKTVNFRLCFSTSKVHNICFIITCRMINFISLPHLYGPAFFFYIYLVVIYT